MANVSFGGGSDPSSIFAGLNRQYLQDIEVLARNAERRADEITDAADADMFDKWKNGLLDDDAWLAYIDSRVAETSGDKKEHQKWIEAQREYRTAISDSQAEASFEAGESTIHETIAYYRKRLSGLEEDSDAYRKTQGRLYEYVDKAASDDIYYAAQDIADGIALGTSSVGDMINFYKGKLSGLRPNSTLYDQIRKEIRSLQSRQNTVGGGSGGGGGGGGSGGGGGGRSRGSGSSRYSSSPADDYRAVTASGIVPRSGYILGRAASGISNEALNFSGLIPGLDLDQTIEYLKQVEQGSYEVVQQIGNDLDTLTNPFTGEVLPATPENQIAVGLGRMDNLEMLAHAQDLSGDTTAATKTRGNINDTLSNVILPARGVTFMEGYNTLMSNIHQMWDRADNSGEPDATRAVAAYAEGAITDYVKVAVTNAQPARRRRNLRVGAVDELVAARGNTPSARPVWQTPTSDLLNAAMVPVGFFSAHAVGDADGEAGALAFLGGDLPDSFNLDKTLFTSPGTGFSETAFANTRATRGLREGTHIMVYDIEQEENGGWDVIQTANLQPGAGRQVWTTGTDGVPRSQFIPSEPSIREALPNFDPDQGHREFSFFRQTRKGTYERALGIMRPTLVEGVNVVMDSSGRIIPSEQFSDAKKLKDNLASGTWRVGQGFYSPAVIYRDPKTGQEVTKWWVDQGNGDGGFSHRPPHANMLGGVREINGFMVHEVDQSGSLTGSYRQFLHNQLEPVLLMGDDVAGFQRAVNRGEVDGVGDLARTRMVGPDGTVLDGYVDISRSWYAEDSDSQLHRARSGNNLPAWADRRAREMKEGQERDAMRAQMGKFLYDNRQEVEPGPFTSERDAARQADSREPYDMVNSLFQPLREYFKAMNITTGETDKPTGNMRAPFGSKASLGGRDTGIDGIIQRVASATQAASTARVAVRTAPALPKITLPNMPTRPLNIDLARLPVVAPPAKQLASAPKVAPPLPAKTFTPVPKAPAPAPTKTLTPVAKTPAPVVRRTGGYRPT